MRGGGGARALGQWGEDRTAEWLQARGWRIVTRNFRCRMGEIDIIAENGSYGAACEAVTLSKRRKLRVTAEYYLMGHPTQLQPRFDVAEVYAPQGVRTEQPDIYYIENAF